MNERILCVDDDPNVLEAYQRHLRKRFHIEPVLSAEEALEMIIDDGPYAVVVADARLPGMDGIQLLTKVNHYAPDTVRMVLTGHADLETALEAVNDGHIFRFLVKPCPPETLAKALEAGISQYRLIASEHEILSQTLHGSVKVLTDVLALANPMAFGRASRVHRLVSQMCKELRLDRTWSIEVAAMLSQIGCVAVPEETLAKVQNGAELSDSEAATIRNLPEVGHGLIAKVPRLEEVAEIIAHQENHYYAEDSFRGAVYGNELPLGSRILKVALDFDGLVSGGMSNEMALAKIHDRPGWYDPSIVAVLKRIPDIHEAYVPGAKR